jgi:hypothetical protein
MTAYDWNETARGLAGFVGKFRFIVERGVVPLQLENDDAAPRRGSLLFGVFGKDDEDGTSGHREAENVRNQLHGDPALHELGFGTSGDGATWAMLIAADKTQFNTLAGQALQKELLKISLEEAVQRAVEPQERPLNSGTD